MRHVPALRLLFVTRALMPARPPVIPVTESSPVMQLAQQQKPPFAIQRPKLAQTPAMAAMAAAPRQFARLEVQFVTR